jgi:hypothetical protein
VWWTGQRIVRGAHVVNEGDVVVHILSGVRILADWHKLDTVPKACVGAAMDEAQERFEVGKLCARTVGEVASGTRKSEATVAPDFTSTPITPSAFSATMSSSIPRSSRTWDKSTGLPR